MTLACCVSVGVSVMSSSLPCNPISLMFALAAILASSAAASLIRHLNHQRWRAGAAKMTQEQAAQSGAAASSAALAQAIRGLCLLLCATLGDKDTPPGSAAAHSRRREAPPAANSAEALSALRALAVSAPAADAKPAVAEDPVQPAAHMSGQVESYSPMNLTPDLHCSRLLTRCKLWCQSRVSRSPDPGRLLCEMSCVKLSGQQ